MKINLGLFGGSGKMGKSVERIITSVKTKHQLFPFLFIGKDTSDVFAFSAANIKNVDVSVLEDIHVWIDFTSSNGLLELLKFTEKYKTPIVSGSTGLSSQNLINLKKASKKRPLFWSSNMSPGLWAFRQALKNLSSLSSFDIAIEEIHHNQKKDKPSGTAKTLHIDLENIMNKKIETPTSFRLGGVFGIHTISMASSNEIIKMEHQALNREVFAEGALIASDWLITQKSGFYSMDNLYLSTHQI